MTPTPTLTRNVDDAEGPPIFMSSLLHSEATAAFVKASQWPDVLRGFNNSTPGDAARRQVVRYDLPEWHGFA